MPSLTYTFKFLFFTYSTVTTQDRTHYRIVGL